MLKNFKKITYCCALVFLLLFLNSCEEKECVEADEYFNRSYSIQSNPQKYTNPDVIYGSYNDDPNSFGQVAEWHDTKLTTNGDPIILKISGGWVSQNAKDMTEDQFKQLPECTICSLPANINLAKTPYDKSTTNCYCQKQKEDEFYNNNNISSLSYENSSKQTINFTREAQNNVIPLLIKDEKGVKSVSVIECTSDGDKKDSEKCTCDPLPSGKNLNDGDIFHFPLNAYHKEIQVTSDKKITLAPIGQDEKNEVSYGDVPSHSSSRCRFRRGMGAFISLWGTPNAPKSPERIYHLFSLEKNCPIGKSDLEVIDSNNQKTTVKDSDNNNIKTCVNKNGEDLWEFIYRSPDNRIFKKNDKGEYHKKGEVVKLLINDNFYNDNYGQYKITFISGVNTNKNTQILELIVSKVEELLLGTVDDDKRNNDSIIEFMYKSLIFDQNIAGSIQLALVFYILIFGMSYMLGIVELETKEVVMRIIKLGLVVMFTTYSSWSLYKLYVVDFFKEGMDFLSGRIMGLFDRYMGGDTIALVSSQQNHSIGQSSRFSYADHIILDLTSSAVSKKIWGLFFMEGGSAFGLLYIIIIYGLVLYLIYVMMTIALMYIVNLLKLVFVLSLGPVFISFSLFSKTEQYYKNWLGFLGARSLEMVILFLSLYPFLITIDQIYKEMFHYQTCYVDLVLGPGSINVLSSKIHRGLFDWFFFFLKILSLTFMTYSIAKSSSDISGQLINIGGVPNRDSDSQVGYGSGSFGIASGAMKEMLSAAKTALSSKYIGGVLAKITRTGVSLTTQGFRSLGVGSYLGKTLARIPIARVLIKYPGPRSMLRNYYIDSAINDAIAQAGNKKGIARDKFIRNAAMANLQRMMNNSRNMSSVVGMDMHNIAKRFDERLVKDPMKKFIKAEAQKLKNEQNPKIGKELREELRMRAENWAKQNLVSGSDKVANQYLEKGNNNSIRDYVRRKAEYRVSEVVQKFGNNPEMQKSFLEELQKNEIRNERKSQDSSFLKKNLGIIERGIGDVKDKIIGFGKWRRQNLHLNPKNQRKRFLNKLRNTNPEQSRESINRMHQESIISLLEKNKGINLIDRSQSYNDQKVQAKSNFERIALLRQLNALAIKDIDLPKPDKPNYSERLSNIRSENDLRISDKKTLFEKVSVEEELEKRIHPGRKDLRIALSEIINEETKKVASELKNFRESQDLDSERLEKLNHLQNRLVNLERGLLSREADSEVIKAYDDYKSNLNVTDLASSSRFVGSEILSSDLASSTQSQTDNLSNSSEALKTESNSLNSDKKDSESVYESIIRVERDSRDQISDLIGRNNQGERIDVFEEKIEKEINRMSAEITKIPTTPEEIEKIVNERIEAAKLAKSASTSPEELSPPQAEKKTYASIISAIIGKKTFEEVSGEGNSSDNQGYSISSEFGNKNLTEIENLSKKELELFSAQQKNIEAQIISLASKMKSDSDNADLIGKEIEKMQAESGAIKSKITALSESINSLKSYISLRRQS